MGSYSDRRVDHYRGLVDNASRVKGALPLGIDTVLSAMVLTIASRSRSKSLAQQWWRYWRKTLLRMKKHHFGPWWARKGPPEGERVSWEEFGSLWGPDGHNKQKGPNRQIARFLLEKWQFWCFHGVFTKREKKIVAAAFCRCQFYQGRDTIYKKKSQNGHQTITRSRILILR